MGFQFDSFSMSQMILCGRALRACGDGATSMEQAAQNIVNYLYDAFQLKGRDGEERNACALLRLFITHPLDELEPGQREFAHHLMGNQYDQRPVQCLTLLASRGKKEEWNDRRRSNGHVAIPLPSEESVSAIPMVAQLVKQLDLDVNSVIKPDPELMIKLSAKSCGVFHVQEARGSRYIPAQESFVIPNKIKSVLGFGGVFPQGAIYTAILFSYVSISRETAERFQTLSLHSKMALLPFSENSIFMSAVPAIED